MGTFPKYKSFRTAIIFAVGLAAVFVTANAPVGFLPRLAISAAILLVGLALVSWFSTEAHSPEHDRPSVKERSEPALEEELSILDEAAVFFSASMEPAEMLRLVAARLEGALKESAVEFFLSGDGSDLRKIGSQSPNALKESAGRLSLIRELASRALGNVQIERGESGGTYCVAVPLTRGGNAVAAYSISSRQRSLIPDEETLLMLASRIEPILGGTLSFASTVSNALTDNLTNLPNERALFLILENQVAEAQRFGDVRSLTVLAVDILAFDEINQKFGHSAGDRLLTFAGALIRDQLRKMDFLARMKGDEFVLILPTAESGASENIQERIAKAFDSTPFEIADGIRQKIRLSYGSATFGKDADTSGGLVKAAVENKLRAKSTDRGAILQFPKRDEE